jgi:ERCC4-type nuclease
MDGKEIKVLVDSRERNADLICSMELLGASLEFKAINVGDYVLSDRICIERKTVSDFESSLISGRLFDQVKRLKDSYEFPILVLEGDPDMFRLKSSVINGAIAKLYVRYGINAIFTYGPENTAEIIVRIAKQEQEGEDREPSPKGGARAHTKAQFQEYVIGNIPGVGPKIARALLGHFGSIKGIANADEKELTSVAKVGKKKAALIHGTLTDMYGVE